MLNIPNALTLLNLACGSAAIICLFQGQSDIVLVLFGLALLFDFFDGMTARWLDQKSELGAHLDSFADLVSFGVLPGMMIYQIMSTSQDENITVISLVLSLLFICGVALRLSKFNVDTRQDVDFLGLNSPAAGIAVVGLYVHYFWESCHLLPLNNTSIIVPVVIAIFIVFMLVNLPMLSFKPDFTNRRRNVLQGILILGSIILLTWKGLCTLTLIVLWYIVFSILIHWVSESRSNQS